MSDSTTHLTAEAAHAAARYLLDMHECISNDELAEACERAAAVLISHARERERWGPPGSPVNLYRAAAQAAHLCALEGFGLDEPISASDLAGELDRLADLYES